LNPKPQQVIQSIRRLRL